MTFSKIFSIHCAHKSGMKLEFQSNVFDDVRNQLVSAHCTVTSIVFLWKARGVPDVSDVPRSKFGKFFDYNFVCNSLSISRINSAISFFMEGGGVGLNSVINDTIFFLLDCTGLWFSHHGSDPDVWTHFGRTFQSCRFLGAAGQFPDYHFSSCLLCTGSNRRCCSGSHALKRVS